jgi:hypothetical protein
MKISDKQIIKKIKKGDIKAFELFFKQNYKALCNYAFHYLKNAEDIEKREASKEIAFKRFQSDFFYPQGKGLNLTKVKKNFKCTILKYKIVIQ